MPIVVKSMVSMEITNAPATFFRSGPITTASDQFTQTFGADITIQPAVVNQAVSLQGADRAQQMFILCDQPILLVLEILVSGVPTPTPPIELKANVPSMLAFSNVVGMQVTNTTLDVARLMVYGAGIEI
jgi:hypothetical protein